MPTAFVSLFNTLQLLSVFMLMQDRSSNPFSLQSLELVGYYVMRPGLSSVFSCLGTVNLQIHLAGAFLEISSCNCVRYMSHAWASELHFIIQFVMRTVVKFDFALLFIVFRICLARHNCPI